VWLFFGLMVLAISWGAAASVNRHFDWPNGIAWNLGWLWWAAATFVVRLLARRFPLERQGLVRRLLLHAAFGLLVTALVICLEYLLNRFVVRTWPVTLRPNPLVSFVAYKFHIYFLIYWLIVGASGAYDFQAKLRRSELTASQLETQLAQAQVQALRMQLHPHFLFNTHHSIISLMLKNENSSAIKMLTRLSDLLRLTLKKTDQPMNSLREELEMLELYLGIQRERYRERLDVKIDVAPDLLDAEVPSLLLQPLVENALQHGIDPQASGGRLTVSIHRQASNLIMSVHDNGPGLPTNFRLEQQTGVGVSNTRARLERLYGAQQRFEIASTGTDGTEVRVMLPLRILSSADDVAVMGTSTT
jgi:sensor histidine kinase YesM